MADTKRAESRYNQLTMERFHAMVAGREFRRLKHHWLSAIGRRTSFRNLDEWIEEEIGWRERDPGSWEALQGDVANLSWVYGITEWHVLWALFVKHYDPTLQQLATHPDFMTHRQQCLEAFGLKKPFRNVDLFLRWHSRLSGQDLSVWESLEPQVTSLAEGLGATPTDMLLALLIQNYQPLKSAGLMFPLDAWSPKPRLIVRGTSPLQLEGLALLGQQQEMYVEFHPAPPEDESFKEPCGNFSIGLDIPLEYPPELAAHRAKRALNLGRDMLRGAGLNINQRIHQGSSTTCIKTSLILMIGNPGFLDTLKNACGPEGMELVLEPVIATASGDGSPKPTPLSAVRLRLEFPPDVGSEDLVKATRLAIRSARKTLKNAGLDLGKRLRIAPTASQIQALAVDGGRLAPRGLGDLVEAQTGDFPASRGILTPQARMLKRSFKSRRGKVQKRLRRKGLLPPK